MSLDGGFKSLISRWFSKKKRKKEEDYLGKDGDVFLLNGTHWSNRVQRKEERYPVSIIGYLEYLTNPTTGDLIILIKPKCHFQSTVWYTVEVEDTLKEIQTFGEDDE